MKRHSFTENRPRLPSQEALERFAKPLPVKRKALRGGGKDVEGGSGDGPATEPAIAVPKERLRLPGELPDRLKFDADGKGAGRVPGESPEEASGRLTELRDDLQQRVEGDLDGKAYPPITQDFQTAHNAAMSRKESGAHRRADGGVEYSERDKLLPPTLDETLWRLRYRIGLILAVCAVVAGIIASIQFEQRSYEQLLVPTMPREMLTGPKEIAERFLSAETSHAERLALLREPFDPERVREYFDTVGVDSENEVRFIVPQDQFQMLDIGYAATGTSVSSKNPAASKSTEIATRAPEPRRGLRY
jgi:hypothetical protein